MHLHSRGVTVVLAGSADGPVSSRVFAPTAGVWRIWIYGVRGHARLPPDLPAFEDAESDLELEVSVQPDTEAVAAPLEA